MDLSGLDASPAEVGDLLDAIAEADADGGAHDADQAAADWAASLSDSEFSEMLASYEADTQLPGPELAGADVGGVIDLAAEMDAIDVMLAAQTDREATRRAEDQAGVSRRGSTEMRLMRGLARVQAGTFTYGQEPPIGLANWQGGADTDALFNTGPVAGPQHVISELRYQLHGGVAPSRSRRQPGLPPVQDLAARIGLR